MKKKKNKNKKKRRKNHKKPLTGLSSVIIISIRLVLFFLLLILLLFMFVPFISQPLMATSSLLQCSFDTFVALQCVFISFIVRFILLQNLMQSSKNTNVCRYLKKIKCQNDCFPVQYQKFIKLKNNLLD